MKKTLIAVVCLVMSVCVSAQDTSKVVISMSDTSMDVAEIYSINAYMVKSNFRKGYPPVQIQNGKMVVVGTSWEYDVKYYDMKWNELDESLFIWNRPLMHNMD